MSFLYQAQEGLELSVRGFENTLKLAGTIAALEGCARIEARHMAEALQYRFENWLHLLC